MADFGALRRCYSYFAGAAGSYLYYITIPERVICRGKLHFFSGDREKSSFGGMGNHGFLGFGGFLVVFGQKTMVINHGY